MTPVVLITEELAPAAIDILAQDFDVRHVDGTDRAALLDALAEAEAVIVRSATQIDAAAIAAAPRLKVIARAGVGLDNVEVSAATARGVMVVNAPTANIVSAAEQAVALLLAVARNTVAASTALKAGEWQRSRYTGVEIAGKTIGVVGLGRIGVLFAQRMAAFGARLIAYDPYVQPARAAQLGVRLVGLEELLRAVRLHLHPPAQDPGDGGVDRCPGAGDGQARGAHHQRRARWAGGRAGARRRPRRGSGGRRRHRRLRQGAVHLLAAVPVRERGGDPAPGRLHRTRRRTRPGTAVARSVKLALQGEFVPDAVNVQAGGVVAEEVRPLLPLAEKLGKVFTAVAGGVAASVTVEVRGPAVGNDVSVLRLAATKGLFSGVVEEQVTYVNAPLIAADRGVEVDLGTFPESPELHNVVSVRGAMPDGRAVSVSGSLWSNGVRDTVKLTEVDGFDLELDAEGILLFFRYVDRPGVVGRIGTALGAADVNIAAMQVSRRSVGGDALMALTVDSAINADLLQEAAAEIGATAASAVDLRLE